jgi:tetratricopeptide (TPR) repeat protein
MPEEKTEGPIDGAGEEHIPLNAGARLLRSGDPARALAAFDAILSTNPGLPAGLHGRGLALAALGRTEEALAAFRAALAAGPDAWNAAASIADLSPDESERIAALECSANILVGLCGAPARPRLFEAAAGALADAHRHHDLASFVRRHSGRFASPARPYDWLAKASYEVGRFGDALTFKQAALDFTLPPDGSRSQAARFCPADALRALDDLAAIFDANGVTYFPVAGTLLGLHRSGGPLAHDRDIDIGVFASPGPGPDIASLLRADPRVMMARSARPGDRYFAIIHRGVAIDIFIHDVQHGHANCGVSYRPGDIQWRFTAFGLQPGVIGGRQWNLPCPAERYLAESYGPSWKVPDRGYASAVSSPALFGVDIRVRSLYAAARARTALLSGDREKAIALAQQSPVAIRLPRFDDKAS